MNWAEKLHHAAVKKVAGDVDKFPHGECECRGGCGCAGIPGPAAFTVVRDDKTIKVCTRCDFGSDVSTRKPLPKRGEDLSVYEAYDPMGAFCLFPPEDES